LFKTGATKALIGVSIACARRQTGERAPSALALITEQALAKRAAHLREQPPIAWYRLSDNVGVKCVERSFSVSVGNPAYPNRLAMWPGPCRP
jgi:hypothetical protein